MGCGLWVLGAVNDGAAVATAELGCNQSEVENQGRNSAAPTLSTLRHRRETGEAGDGRGTGERPDRLRWLGVQNVSLQNASYAKCLNCG